MDLNQRTYEQYLEALLAGDRQTCARYFESFLGVGVAPRALYVDLVQRSLHEVGRLWETGTLSVAGEHVATAISQGLLNTALSRVVADEGRSVGKRVLVAALSPELHQVGAQIVADTFESHGWDGVFVGGNTPAGELLREIDDKRPDLLALSLTMFFNLDALEGFLRTLRDHHTIEVVIGGQGLRRAGPDLAASFEGVDYLPNLAALDTFVHARQPANKEREGP